MGKLRALWTMGLGAATTPWHEIKDSKARGSAPGPRWGRRPQTPILLVPSSTSTPSQVLELAPGPYRRLPPRSVNAGGGTPSGVQGAEPPGLFLSLLLLTQGGRPPISPLSS